MSSLKDKPDDREQLWRLRWFFAFFQVLLVIASIITFWITRNPSCLSLIPAPLLLRRFEHFLFPMSPEEKEYKLKKEELKLRMQEVRLKALELQQESDTIPAFNPSKHTSDLIAEWLKKYI